MIVAATGGLPPTLNGLIMNVFYMHLAEKLSTSLEKPAPMTKIKVPPLVLVVLGVMLAIDVGTSPKNVAVGKFMKPYLLNEFELSTAEVPFASTSIRNPMVLGFSGVKFVFQAKVALPKGKLVSLICLKQNSMYVVVKS